MDLSRPFAATASTHHRRYARRCARLVDIEPCRAPLDHLEDWCRLYDELADRHAMSGPARFSRGAFRLQLGLPGVRLLRAVAPDNAVVGMQLWFVDGEHAWYHLGAHGAAGYAAGVSFGLFAAAFALLRREGVRTVDLGGGAGLADDPEDGLSRFKAGWATHTATAWLGGAVLDRTAYARLCAGRRGAYFPLYRAPAPERADVPEDLHAHVG
ncbi:MAG: GNAT family N-acetyltransferase [Candidatus Krumholzibacteriia bacterium]